MTPEICQAFCKSSGSYIYAGVENSTECYCGNTLTNNSPPSTTPATDCAAPCAGDSSKICGGTNWKMTVFKAPYAATSTNAGSLTGWTAKGCYVDQSARTLNGASKTDNNMTPAMCQSYCGSAGFTYAGVENKVECYCGNSLTVSKVSTNPTTECAAPCGGDATLICGGTNWRMNIYQYTGSAALQSYTQVGCFVDSATRVLQTSAPSATPSWSAQGCQAYCAGLGLPYSGNEHLTQCWCGDRIVMSSGGGALAPTSDCTGGTVGWRVMVYYNPAFDYGSCSSFS
ncbi:hypothetical protein FRB90_001057 [Tulasnella sp. 427]|nr:hypothetical protein FRB90_001057 [Tulasnella sp. 427]